MNSSEEIPVKRDSTAINTHSAATEPDRPNQEPDTSARSTGDDSSVSCKLRTLIRFYSDCLTLAAKGSLKSFRSEHHDALGIPSADSEVVPKGGGTLDPPISSSSDRRDGDALMASLINSVVEVTQGRAASRLGILNEPYYKNTADSSTTSPIDGSLKGQFYMTMDIPWYYGTKSGGDLYSSLGGGSGDSDVGVLVEAEAVQSVLSR